MTMEKDKEVKRLFQILDEMNLDDTRNGTKNVRLSNAFISADKVKQGAKIAMGAEESVLNEIMSNKVIPILLIVDKEEYFKRKS